MNNLLGFMTVVFVCLKLNGNIDCSWWLVFTPSLVSASLALIADTLTMTCEKPSQFWRDVKEETDLVMWRSSR